MAAFWLERRRRQEAADRRWEQERAERALPLLPLEETSPGVGLDADTDLAGSTPPADLPRLGDVSSNGSAVVEETSGTEPLGAGRQLGVSSTTEDVAA